MSAPLPDSPPHPAVPPAAVHDSGAAFPVPDTIGVLVTDAARLLRRRFDARARRIGVSRAQWQVLIALARAQGINQAALAERLEVETITVGRMVDRLADAGLVERRADPDDRRAWQLFLTPHAVTMLADLAPIAADLRAEMLDGFDAAEQAQLHALLVKLRTNLARDA